mgnify:CR=1 FL=1
MRALDRILAEMAMAFAKRARRDLFLRELVCEAFEATGDRKDYVRRIDVYRYVAQRLRTHLNNDRCVEIRSAVLQLPGVYCVRGGQRHFFKGLRLKARERPHASDA